jgi:hypothetical protein
MPSSSGTSSLRVMVGCRRSGSGRLITRPDARSRSRSRSSPVGAFYGAMGHLLAQITSSEVRTARCDEEQGSGTQPVPRMEDNVLADGIGDRAGARARTWTVRATRARPEGSRQADGDLPADQGLEADGEPARCQPRGVSESGSGVPSTSTPRGGPIAELFLRMADDADRCRHARLFLTLSSLRFDRTDTAWRRSPTCRRSVAMALAPNGVAT